MRSTQMVAHGFRVVVVAGKAVDRHLESVQQFRELVVAAGSGIMYQVAGRKDQVGLPAGLQKGIDYRAETVEGVDAQQAPGIVRVQVGVRYLQDLHAFTGQRGGMQVALTGQAEVYGLRICCWHPGGFSFAGFSI